MSEQDETPDETPAVTAQAGLAAAAAATGPDDGEPGTDDTETPEG